jgi:hypothetical protein
MSNGEGTTLVDWRVLRCFELERDEVEMGRMPD